MNAISKAENIEEQVRRLEQQLHEARLACDMKEIELRMAREKIINIKVYILIYF